MQSSSTSIPLALLIAAAPPNAPAMHNDLRALTQPLLARGLPAERIFALHGQLDRALLPAFLAAARRRMDGRYIVMLSRVYWPRRRANSSRRRAFSASA